MRKELIGAVALAALMATPAVARETRAKAPAAASSMVAKAATAKAKPTSAKATKVKQARAGRGAGKAGIVTAAVVAVPSVVISKNEITQAELEQANAADFGATLAGNVATEFSIDFDFVLDEAMLASGSVTTQLLGGNDIDFSSILLDGFAFTQTGFDPQGETFTLELSGLLGIGEHTLTVNGTTGSSGKGAFGGNINLVPNGGTGPGGGAVPEPGTWAMMLLGFGGMGVAMRRRRSGTLMQQMA